MPNRRAISNLGVYLYGVASIVCGIFDLMWGGFDQDHQPIQAFGDHIPGVALMAYVAGVWMVAGGAAILWRRTEKWGGAALVGIYLVFAMFWLPRFYTAPRVLGHRIPVYIGIAGGVGIEVFAAAAGLLVWASLASRTSSWTRAVLIARWACGVCAVIFGLGHLTDVKDVLVYVPRWMPQGQEFWVIVTGISFVLAGLAILSGIRDVLAARLLALLFLMFNVLALPQFIFADPKGHAAWGGNAFNLALVAAAWILADSLASRPKGSGLDLTHP